MEETKGFMGNVKHMVVKAIMKGQHQRYSLAQLVSLLECDSLCVWSLKVG